MRRFQSRDLPRVSRIEQNAFGDAAWPDELFRYYAAMSPRLFLVAQIDGRIAGYSITCPVRAGAELVSIAVAPGHRRRRIATSLIRSTSRKLKLSGVRVLWLTVRPDNPIALRLYRGLGFLRTRTIRGYYEDGSDGWRMRLGIG